MGSRTTAVGPGLVPGRADTDDPGRVVAPFLGLLTPLVAVGDLVVAGQVLATLEAMKMEAPVTAPRAGRVERLGVTAPRTVAGGDLVAVLR